MNIGPHPVERYFTIKPSVTEHCTWEISMGGVPLAKAYEQMWIMTHGRPIHYFCPPWKVYVDNSFMRAAHGTEDNQLKCRTLKDLYMWLLDNGCMDYVRGVHRLNARLANEIPNAIDLRTGRDIASLLRTLPIPLEEGVRFRFPSENQKLQFSTDGVFFEDIPFVGDINRENGNHHVLGPGWPYRSFTIKKNNRRIDVTSCGIEIATVYQPPSMYCAKHVLIDDHDPEKINGFESVFEETTLWQFELTEAFYRFALQRLHIHISRTQLFHRFESGLHWLVRYQAVEYGTEVSQRMSQLWRTHELLMREGR